MKQEIVSNIILIFIILLFSAGMAMSVSGILEGHSPPPDISHTTIPPPEDTVDYWHLWTLSIIEVESGGDDYAVGRTSDYGCLQITPILIKDVNRIQSVRKFTMNDARDRGKSIEIYNIIQAYYNPGHDRHLALKIWNPRAPVSYHKKVEQEYIKLLNTKYGTTKNIKSTPTTK